jgi:hypothetical protein
MRRPTMVRFHHQLTEVAEMLQSVKMAFDAEKGADMRRMTDKLAVAEGAVDDAAFDLIEIIEKAH